MKLYTGKQLEVVKGATFTLTEGEVVTVSEACQPSGTQFIKLEGKDGLIFRPEDFKEYDSGVKSFIVDIMIQTCGYEKSNQYLVTDVKPEDEQYLFEFCATLEGHNDLEMDGTQVDDGGYEFLYAAQGHKEVSHEHLQVLKQYMRPWEFDMDEVRNITGFEE